MDFKQVVENYKTVVTKQYCCFDGNADRFSFWSFVIANAVINAVLSAIHPVLGGIFSLAVLLPTLGIGVRRMHDIGKSGWMILVNLIPLVGWLIYIILCLQPSKAAAEE